MSDVNCDYDFDLMGLEEMEVEIQTLKEELNLVTENDERYWNILDLIAIIVQERNERIEHYRLEGEMQCHFKLMGL